MYYTNGELSIFPSKEQRDWSKWAEEQKTKTLKKQKPKTPKTWGELIRQGNIEEYMLVKTNFLLEYTCIGNTPIEKAALALLKIYQLIEAYYGGNVTKDEFNDPSIKVYYIAKLSDDWIMTASLEAVHTHIAFHTLEQMEEFISYPENVQLIKDYFMI